MNDAVRDPVDGMTDDEVLNLLGPAWSAMSRAQRLAYGPRPARRPCHVRSRILEQWGAEVAAGTRTIDTTDGLWRAACWSADAVEAAARGDMDGYRASRRRVGEILRTAEAAA